MKFDTVLSTLVEVRSGIKTKPNDEIYVQSYLINVPYPIALQGCPIDEKIDGGVKMGIFLVSLPVKPRAILER